MGVRQPGLCRVRTRVTCGWLTSTRHQPDGGLVAQRGVTQNHRMPASAGKTRWTCSCCRVYASVSVSVPGAGGRSSSEERPLARPSWCPSVPTRGTAEPLHQAQGATGQTPPGEESPVWKSEENGVRSSPVSTRVTGGEGVGGARALGQVQFLSKLMTAHQIRMRVSTEIVLLMQTHN